MYRTVVLFRSNRLVTVCIRCLVLFIVLFASEVYFVEVAQCCLTVCPNC